MHAEDAVFFNQIRDARLPLVSPPAGHGHHQESKRRDIHDRGSLHYGLNVALETASAEHRDTTRAALTSEFIFPDFGGVRLAMPTHDRVRAHDD